VANAVVDAFRAFARSLSQLSSLEVALSINGGTKEVMAVVKMATTIGANSLFTAGHACRVIIAIKAGLSAFGIEASESAAPPEGLPLIDAAGFAGLHAVTHIHRNREIKISRRTIAPYNINFTALLLSLLGDRDRL
jgi:hypothetical protein